jgi:hypothetical protein
LQIEILSVRTKEENGAGRVMPDLLLFSFPVICHSPLRWENLIVNMYYEEEFDIMV